MVKQYGLGKPESHIAFIIQKKQTFYSNEIFHSKIRRKLKLGKHY